MLYWDIFALFVMMKKMKKKGGEVVMITLQKDKIGSDHLIKVFGGTKPHIGAVVIATWEDDEVKLESFGLPHHKERELFIELAIQWCKTFQRTTVITGGIHIDQATKQEIQSLVKKTWEKFFDLMEHEEKLNG